MPVSVTAASSNVLTLNEYLDKHLWPEEWLKLGPTRDYLWVYDLETSPEKLWPYLADVSAFNQMIGLSEMKFTEKDGEVFGIAQVPAGKMAWKELPWEWDYGKTIGNARVYTEGFFKVFRNRYQMERLGENCLRLYVYFGVIPKGFYGKLVARIFFKGLEQKYTKAYQTILQYIQKQEKLILASRPVLLKPEVQKRLDEIQRNLVKQGVSSDLAAETVDFVKSAAEEDLVRIRLKPLAREWNRPERELLETFLKATREGLFNLTWDVICPHCRGVRQEMKNLGDLPQRGNCAVCKIDFDATSFNALEVTFHVHPSIRTVQRRLYCSAEPARKPHIRLQKTLAPQGEITLESLLGLGRYRLRVQGREVYNLLDVEDKEAGRKVEWEESAAQQNFKAGFFPVLTLRNASSEAATFVLEENQLDLDTLRPVDLFSFQGFRDLFSQEALAADLKLEVGLQTILFTDLVGSTKFYETEGDTVAFSEVRSHFLKAYEVVKQNGGAVVKTIGDAVMAAFSKPLDAIRAAVELQRYFNGRNPETRLRLRVTLNSGSCLAVNLNSNIDYFGNTVNLSAKIQSTSNAGQIGFTEAVAKDGEVTKFLGESRLPVEKLDFEMKWAKKTIPVYRVEVS